MVGLSGNELAQPVGARAAHEECCSTDVRAEFSVRAVSRPVKRFQIKPKWFRMEACSSCTCSTNNDESFVHDTHMHNHARRLGAKSAMPLRRFQNTRRPCGPQQRCTESRADCQDKSFPPRRLGPATRAHLRGTSERNKQKQPHKVLKTLAGVAPEDGEAPDAARLVRRPARPHQEHRRRTTSRHSESRTRMQGHGKAWLRRAFGHGGV